MTANHILIVDDQPHNRQILHDLCQILGHEAVLAENGQEAFDILQKQSIDLILSDILMPVMDGFELLRRVKADPDLRDIPILMITALDDLESVIKCIQGGADDYLIKPFNSVLLRARVDACLEKKGFHDQAAEYRRQIEDYNHNLERRVVEEVSKTNAAHLGMIFGLSKLAESRDPETGDHLERMREYCRLISIKLATLPKYSDTITDIFIRSLHIASPMHDIGKVGIPDHILLKPGKLTVEEFSIMKTHTLIGAKTLSDVNTQYAGNALVEMGVKVAESHHEKWDGSGYPYGLKGEEIPLSGRILALGDVYDALTSKRCYKEAFSQEKTRAIILEGRGTHFDPDIVDVFLQCEDDFTRLRSNLK